MTLILIPRIAGVFITLCSCPVDTIGRITQLKVAWVFTLGATTPPVLPVLAGLSTRPYFYLLHTQT